MKNTQISSAISKASYYYHKYDTLDTYDFYDKVEVDEEERQERTKKNPWKLKNSEDDKDFAEFLKKRKN